MVTGNEQNAVKACGEAEAGQIRQETLLRSLMRPDGEEKDKRIRRVRKTLRSGKRQLPEPECKNPLKSV